MIIISSISSITVRARIGRLALTGGFIAFAVAAGAFFVKVGNWGDADPIASVLSFFFTLAGTFFTVVGFVAEKSARSERTALPSATEVQPATSPAVRPLAPPQPTVPIMARGVTTQGMLSLGGNGVNTTRLGCAVSVGLFSLVAVATATTLASAGPDEGSPKIAGPPPVTPATVDPTPRPATSGEGGPTVGQPTGGQPSRTTRTALPGTPPGGQQLSATMVCRPSCQTSDVILTLDGSIKGSLQAGHRLILFVRAPDGRYYPGSKGQIRDGAWSGKVHVGSSNGTESLYAYEACLYDIDRAFADYLDDASFDELNQGLDRVPTTGSARRVVCRKVFWIRP